MTLDGSEAGRLLVVDDNRVNRLVLQRALEALGHQTVPAPDGVVALDLLAAEPFDAVLLDVEMPQLDGYGTLQRIKAQPSLTHIPVIMVSGVEDIASVVRCIELGAVDYLPKPFNAAVLRARVDAALAAKRVRDRELDVLEQVQRLVEAAAAVEASTFDPTLLDPVAGRADAIGALARVFNTMAHKVVEREQRLRRQIEQMRADAGVVREGEAPALERLASYVAVDRRAALAEGRPLPAVSPGAVLLADITGFTAAVIERSRRLGSDRGAEELLRDLNGLYERVVGEIHRFGGAVVGYAGDGITAWFDEFEGTVDALGAAAGAGLSLQAVATSDETFAGLKVAVATGDGHRLALGDPGVHLVDLLCGPAVEEATLLERHARPGEVVMSAPAAATLGDRVTVAPLEGDATRSSLVAVVGLRDAERAERPWPGGNAAPVDPELLRPWLIPDVYERVVGGDGGFLAELREATALFVALDGLRFGADDAGRLDAAVRWIQEILVRNGGTLIQLTPSASGGYVYACFGVPRSVADDAAAALAAAAELRHPPPGLGLGPCRVGVARGAMRTGGYGGSEHRTYGAIGEQTNLAARLMQTAKSGEVLCDQSVGRAASDEFDALGPRRLKGVARAVDVFRYTAGSAATDRFEALDPLLATLAKVASIFPGPFDPETIEAIHPDGSPGNAAIANLDALCGEGILQRIDREYVFADVGVRVVANARLLYSQRRNLHRDALAHLVGRDLSSVDDEVGWLRSLAEHAQRAEDDEQAKVHLEAAAAAATRSGRRDEALALLEASLRIEQAGAPGRVSADTGHMPR